MAGSKISVLLCCMFVLVTCKYPGEEKHDVGTLEGDVQNWAVLIENYILQVSIAYEVSVKDAGP